MLLSVLFFLVTSPFLGVAGLLLCCVGVYPAQAWILLAHYHVWFQLYDLFLQRGGEPIPTKVDRLSSRAIWRPTEPQLRCGGFSPGHVVTHRKLRR